MRRELLSMVPVMIASLLAGSTIGVIGLFSDDRATQLGWYTVAALAIAIGMRIGWRRHRERTGRAPEPRPFEGDVS